MCVCGPQQDTVVVVLVVVVVVVVVGVVSMYVCMHAGHRFPLRCHNAWDSFFN
jgi:uncharacterized membrane protein